MLHQKADGIAGATAAKAFINFFGRRNGERGCFFIMKGTKAQVISTPFFQFYKTTHHLNNIGAVENLLYGILRNHARGGQITTLAPSINQSVSKS